MSDIELDGDGPPEAEFCQVRMYRDGDRLSFAATIDEWALLLEASDTAAMLRGAAQALEIAAADFDARATPQAKPALRLVDQPEGNDDDDAA